MTESPLRAYLMLRSDKGEWNVKVCRDLGAVQSAWQGRDLQRENVAVLHVGFDRPPSTQFNEIVDSYSDCVLLTAAAKYALPRSFVASEFPVGIVKSTEVFIALQGWGYSIDDPTEEANGVAFTNTTSKQAEPSEWVAAYLVENPSDAESLSERNIYNDSTYLENESGLENEIRHRIGVFRTHHHLGVNNDDPCELARVAPPWLSVRELASLDIPVRARNCFKNNSTKTVSELGELTPFNLLMWPNFGRKSLKDTFQALNAALNHGPSLETSYNELPKVSRLLTEIRKSLLSFSDRDRDIIVSRLGFETPEETLQEVADRYEVSRERIRQIEKKVIQRWIRESIWDDIFDQKISMLLIGRGYPLPVAGVEAVDAWFEGISSHIKFISNIIDIICKDRIFIIEIDKIKYFSLMSKIIWNRIVSEASSTLSSGVGQKWSEEYARSLVQGLLPDTAKEFGTLLWDKLSPTCHFTSQSDGTNVLTSFGGGAEHIVEAILSEADKPLHYTEIAERASDRNQSIELRRALSAASSVGLLFDRGTYGLKSHIPLSESQLARIQSDAEDIIKKGPPGRQWHASEILTEIKNRASSDIQGLDKYILEITLTESTILRSLGRMTWVASKEPKGETRIDLHQAVVAIVQAAGHPLHADEIKERLSATRGVNEFFQIQQVDPLIRLSRGLWGIKDRDETN